MHYKKYILILVLLSGLFSQSQFNRLFPSEYYLGDSRSMAIGNTFLTTSQTSMLALTNPAKLSRLNNSFYFQSSFSSISERRSMVIADMWGDFLANADYVFNDNSYLKNAFGFNYSKSVGELKVGLGFNYSPFTSLNYSYEEEVRSDADLEDGVIGIDDPIIGFHIIKNSGDMYVSSIGASVSFKNSAVGLSYNQIKSTSIKDQVFVNIIDNTEYAQNNLSAVEDYNASFMLNKDAFYAISVDCDFKDINLVLSFEDDASLSSSSLSSMHISEHLGLPIVFSEVNNQLEYNIQGLDYEKPKKIHIGLLYQPKYNSDFSIAFEATKRIWNHDANYSMFLNESTTEYRFGFEYTPIKSFPIRAGLVYSGSPYIILDPKTTLTLGTGKKYNNIAVDFAMNYNMISYMHHDIFPMMDTSNLSCDDVGCDTVRENNLTFQASLRYNF